MSVDYETSIQNESYQQGSYQQGSFQQGSTLHSSLSNSLLLQPTKRILRHRVTEETRQKVRESTESLENRLRVHNMKIRKAFEQKFINRIRTFEAHRHEETKKWEVKTAHSPYHTDLLKADAELFEKICKVRKEKKRLQSKYDKLDAMTGKPKYDIVSDDVIEKASSEIAQLALKRRVIQGDLRVTQKEFNQCEKMVIDEFMVLERKFPAIRDKLAQSREGSLHGGFSSSGSFMTQNRELNSRSGKRSISSSRCDERMILGSSLEDGDFGPQLRYDTRDSSSRGNQRYGQMQEDSFPSLLDSSISGGPIQYLPPKSSHGRENQHYS